MAVASTHTSHRESLLLLKGELTSGLRGDLSKLEWYNHVQTAAKKHSKLKYEGEHHSTLHWDKINPSQVFDAKSCIKETLGASACKEISPRALSDLSRIMNESAGVDGLTTLFYNYKTDRRQVTEFAFLENVGGEESQLKLHYIKIKAEATCSRVLLFSKCKMEMEAEYKVSTFTVKNELLQSQKDSAIQKSLEFLRHSRVLDT